MNILKNILVVSVSFFSSLASASLIVTNNGFIDSSDNLEWLAPSKVASLSDYNAYVAAGWQIATTSDLSHLTANFFTYNLHYSAFDQSVFDGFKAISNTAGPICENAFFCSGGWYHNVGVDGTDIKYEFGFIGLFSQGPLPGLVETDANLVQQYKLDMTSAFITTTLGTYPLYGYSGGNYDTFMVRAVPLPATAWLFGSGMIGLIGFSRKRKAV